MLVVTMNSKFGCVLCFLVALIAWYSYKHQEPIWMRLHSLHENIFGAESSVPSSLPEETTDGELIFTKSQLEKFTDLDRGLYLAIVGKVFDVTRGDKHYGPGGSYHSFVGRDASLAFITGDFDETGLTDDISSLTPRQTKSLYDWAAFYEKDYTYKGKLNGRFYDANGDPTREYYEVEKKLTLAKEEKDNEELKKKLFPPCNIEWAPDVGTRVWCTKRSGGVERNWVGVPRMLYEPGSEQLRCTCVNVKSKEYETYKGSLREYENCAEGATSCIIKNT